jgi:hypothetical protein
MSQVILPMGLERIAGHRRSPAMKRSIAVALVVLTACRGSVVDSTTHTTPRHAADPEAPASTSSTIGSLTKADVEALIADIGPITELDQTRQVVEMVGLVNEPDLLPYLFDAGRFGGTEVLTEAMRILTRVTGERPPSGDLGTQWWFFGSWLMNNGVDPGPAYIPWKAALYANIDPEFEAMLASIDDPVFAAQVQWGGVLRGGIPELNDAQTISVAEADYMLVEEVVFGAVINGQARAYPVRILGHHELANDTLGGEEVSLAYCTLCRTPVLYSGVVAGMVLDFQTSGLLHNSNKVMVDNQTNSLWNQLTGEAFAGPLQGERLTILPMSVTTWETGSPIIPGPTSRRFRSSWPTTIPGCSLQAGTATSRATPTPTTTPAMSCGFPSSTSPTCSTTRQRW